MKIDLRNLDRRVIYLLVLIALSVPIAYDYSVKPAPMKAAKQLFDIVDNLDPKEGIAFLGFDFGPNTIAENLPQAEVVLEHLMRRRVPVAVFSLYVLAEPFLASLPEKVAARLSAETGESWEYGKDWVNLGYRPGGFLIVQAIPKSDDIAALFKEDSRGNQLKNLPITKNLKGLEGIRLVVEFTGLVGMFDTYVQFFQKKSYRPILAHGCTSITIPEAYIYLDSGQLSGLLEGIAGAAWYSNLMQTAYPNRVKDSSEKINTGLGVAHLLIILLVLLGNGIAFVMRRKDA